MRSKWKGKFVDVSLIKQFDRTKNMCFIVYKLALRLAITKIRKKKLNFPWMTPDRKVRRSSATVAALALIRETTAQIFNTLTKDSDIIVWSLRSTIILDFVGMFCEIYSGNKLISLQINRDMLNKKFGEFSLTKRIGQNIHYLNAKKKKKKLKGSKIIKKSKPSTKTEKKVVNKKKK